MTIAIGHVVDWLTATIRVTQSQSIGYQVENNTRKLTGQDVGEPATPYPRNYAVARGLSPGRVSWHPEHLRMGICYNWTGDDCRTLTATQEMLPLLRRLKQLDFHITRIDLAIDMQGMAARVHDLLESWQAGKATTRAQSFIPIERFTGAAKTGDPEQTLYVGHEQSERRLCVYNKAAQQGDPSGHWVRIEYRARGAAAEQALGAVLKHGMTKALPGLIRDLFDAPVGWWQVATSGEGVDIAPIVRQPTQPYQWLVETVLPLLDRELTTPDPASRALYVALYNIVQKHAKTYPPKRTARKP